MKVFLSHSIADKELVNSIKKSYAKNGLQLLVAEHIISVSNTVTIKIEAMIREAEIALFLLTAKGNESKFVHQEIGYVQSIKKPAIYIIQKGHQITGFAYGRDYIELDPEKPHLATRKALNRLILHWQELNKAKEKREQAGLLIAGLVALALFSK